MIKKLTLLAFAVAALVAFAVPASASAAEWQFEGKPLEENATLTLSGFGAFSTGPSGAHGNLHAHITLEPGSTGTVDALTVTNCKGTGGLAGLTCHGTSEKLPWTIHCNPGGTATITSIQLKNTYTGTPIVTTLTGNIIVSGEGGSLNHVSLAGEGTLVNGSTPATVTGTLEADAESQGYSCA